MGTAAVAPGPVGRRAALAMIRERRQDPLGMFVRLRERYGPVVAFRMGPLHMHLVAEPDLVHEVLVTQAEKVRRGRLVQGTRVVLGDGLLTAEGDLHRRHRRIVQPAFHRDRLREYGEVMTRLAAEASDDWRDGQMVDVLSEMSGLTMSVVAEVLFGTEIRGDHARVEAALVDVFRAFDLLALPFSGLRMRAPTRTIRRFRASKEDLEQLIDRIVAGRRNGGGEAASGDLLSLLLAARDEDGQALTGLEVRHEVLTLFAAGLETTANALTFAWHLLARHPEVEERARAEAAALPADPGIDDIPSLGYVEAVLQEAIRLYPPAWMIARRAIAPLELGPYRVAEGDLVMMPPYLIHRDERFWDDPERFDPDRWARPDVPAHRYAYVPFGAGGRKCIGATFAMVEGVLLMATILRRARLVDPWPRAPLPLLPQITLRPGRPVRMEVAGV